MKDNKIYVLGTGCAIPNKNRNAPGTLISIQDKTKILLDIGNGITKKIIDNGVELTEIDYLLISHYHVDHVSDLFYFLKANWMLNRKNKLLIIGPEGLKTFFDYLLMAYSYLGNKLDFVMLKEIKPNISISHETFEISTIPVPHGDKSLAYSIKVNNIKIVYSGDTGYSKKLIGFSRGADILIHECSYTDEKMGEGHVSPRELAEIAREAKVAKLIITHFYPFCDANIDEMESTIKTIFQGEVIFGNDDLIIDF